MTIHDESQLIEKARRGSLDALGALFSRYHTYLLSLANRRIGHRPNARFGASDIVQVTFAKAHQDFTDFEGRTSGSIKGWLRRILLNTLIDFSRFHNESACRASGREVTFDDIAQPNTVNCGRRLIDTKPTPPSEIVKAEDWAMFLRHIMDLPDVDRAVLTLHHFEYHDFHKIGQILRITEATAIKRYQRAKKRLAAEIRKTWKGDT